MAHDEGKNGIWKAEFTRLHLISARQGKQKEEVRSWNLQEQTEETDVAQASCLSFFKVQGSRFRVQGSLFPHSVPSVTSC
jgi:hypothetical protein